MLPLNDLNIDEIVDSLSLLSRLANAIEQIKPNLNNELRAKHAELQNFLSLNSSSVELIKKRRES